MTQTWRKVAPLPSTRNDAAVTVGADGIIYSIGGYDYARQAMSTEVDAYDPATNTWTVLPPLPMPSAWRRRRGRTAPFTPLAAHRHRLQQH